jgi:hypothetical protein
MKMHGKYPKWRRLGLRVARLKDGERITLDRCPLTKQSLKAMAPEARFILARQIRGGLNGINACSLVRRTVKVHEGRIVITRTGAWTCLLP